MKEYPDIPHISVAESPEIFEQPVTVVEQIEGERVAFTVENDEFIYDPEDAAERWPEAIDYITEAITAEDFSEAQRDDDSLTVYGIVPDDDAYPDKNDPIPAPPFCIIDVYSEQDGWLAWGSIRQVARRMGLSPAPVIYNQRVYQATDELPNIPESKYRDGPALGMVVRNEVQGVRARKPSHFLP